MPAISLRLTEQELEALKSWAHDSRRSLQKEIIFRLFADQGVLDVVRPQVVKEIQERASLDAEGLPLEAERGKTARPTTVDQDWLARRAGKKR